MTQTLKTSERLGVVDALRGFALLAIVLLHNLEHYNLFLAPENVPAWLQTIDKYAWDTLFFLFAGKAYATFSLLFGFSFYIQFHNAEKRGIDFRGRFAWRMCLLFLFAQLHALFYNGDILLLYAVVGFALIPVCKLKDKTVFWIALILLLQPYEWGRAIYAMINPDYVVSTGHFIPYACRAQDHTKALGAGVLCKLCRLGRSAVRRKDVGLKRDLQRLELSAGSLHHRPITIRTHDHSHFTNHIQTSLS